MEQRIACSVLIREIYLTWAQDTRTFLRDLSAQGMELDLTQANAVAALAETGSGELYWRAEQCSAPPGGRAELRSDTSHSEKRVLWTHFSPICIISPAKPWKL